jgi:hypothetical protein
VGFVREAAGDRADEIEFNVLIQMVGVGKSRKSEIDRLTADHTIENPTWFDSPMVYVGNVDEICAQLTHVRKATGASYFVVFDTAMEAFAPIVQALRGT